MSNQHSKFAPSSMDRTVICHGAIRMTAGLEDPPTQDTLEGDATHWVASSMLVSRRNNQFGEYRINEKDYLNKPAPNGIIITEEMFDAALTYYKEVMKVAGHGLIHLMHIEEPTALPEIHPDCWGTPDTWIFDSRVLTLYVFDFKYGHKAVSTYENYQLMAYDLGALNHVTNGKGLLDNNIKVRNIIVQPRCFDGNGPVKVFEMKDVDLRPYVNIMNHACQMAERDDATLRPGSHCIGCPARINCPGILEASAMIFDYSTAPVPLNATPEGLSYELTLMDKAMELLKYRKEAIEAEAMKRIQSGSQIPGYGMVQGYSNSRWMVDDSTVVATGKLFGVDFSKPGIDTPAQAKQKLERANIDGGIIDSLMGRQPTSMKLKADDGTRFKQIFSQHKL